jgi:thiamine-phosphate pyrophosphorylase
MTFQKKIENWKLYIITDQDLSDGKSHLQVAEEAIKGGADVIQLRDKSANSGELYRAALQIRDLTRELGIPFIVNDRLDIALAVEADGLHLGQEDLPAKVARKILGPTRILGVSAGSMAEAQQAEADGADYLGVGPVYEARSTKGDAGEPRGLSLISEIRQKCQTPLIAIGGINLENLKDVFQAGAHGVAVISAIVASSDIRLATSSFKKTIKTLKIIS